VGRLQFPCALLPGQPSGCRRWHPCCRRCLLKGCECWFLPHWPQARYCGTTCQDAAEYWRVWLANQVYRASDQGKERRREQSRRYRDRVRQRSALAESVPPITHIEPASSVIEAESRPQDDPPVVIPAVSEGERPGEIPEKSCGLPCHRPGCYVLFLAAVAPHDQKFCSAACRQALRRVRQREARLRRRRRRGARPLHRPRGGPPHAPALMSSHP
jgi:predicted nucleic acid-binding Zn ribbon protein